MITDENWLQIITFVKERNVPIEHACDVFGVKRKEIIEQANIFCELDPCIVEKKYTEVMSLRETKVTWVTVVELRLLGVRLLSRDVKNVGRVRLPCTPVLKSDGDGIVAECEKKYLMYPVPESVLRELWRLRPGCGERSNIYGDHRFMELLMKRIAFLKSKRLCHWSETDVSRNKSGIIQDRVYGVDKQALRKGVLVYENGKIQEWKYDYDDRSDTDERRDDKALGGDERD